MAGEVLQELKKNEQTEAKVDATEFKATAEKFKANPEEWKKSAGEIIKIKGVKDAVAQSLNSADKNSAEFKASQALYEGLNPQMQKEIMRTMYEQKVFEVGKIYKKNIDDVKKETDKGKLEKLNNDIKQNINDYRNLYTSFQKNMNNGNAINDNLPLQDKEQMLITSYKYTPQYKELVNATTQTVVDSYGSTNTTTTTTDLGTEAELTPGYTDFSPQQISSIKTKLDGLSSTETLIITGLTDANSILNIAGNEAEYNQAKQRFEAKYPNYSTPLKTIAELKRDANAAGQDEQNYILGYRRIVDGIVHAGIAPNQINKIQFDSEVGANKNDKDHRGIRLSKENQKTDIIPPTTHIVPSPENLRQEHNYVKIFALNPNYGKPKAQWDEKYPDPLGDRAYMFVQLSLGSSKSERGITWKTAGYNEIHTVNNLEKISINTDNLQSKNVDKNVQMIVSFVGPEDLGFINNNFVNNKDFTSTSNELLKPFIIEENKKNAADARKQQTNNTLVIRYIGPKYDLKNKESEDIKTLLGDPTTYGILEELKDYNNTKKLPEETIETYFTNITNALNDNPEAGWIKEWQQNHSANTPLKLRDQYVMAQKREYLVNLGAQKLTIYETVKLPDNTFTNSKVVGDATYAGKNDKVVDGVPMAQAFGNEQFKGIPFKPIALSKDFFTTVPQFKPT